MVGIPRSRPHLSGHVWYKVPVIGVVSVPETMQCSRPTRNYDYRGRTRREAQMAEADESSGNYGAPGPKCWPGAIPRALAGASPRGTSGSGASHCGTGDSRSVRRAGASERGSSGASTRGPTGTSPRETAA